MRSRSMLIATALCVLGSAASASAEAPNALHERVHAGHAGAVFTATNEAEGNRVAAFLRGRDGGLGAPSFTRTGGHGTGAALGSQGALTLTQDGRFLLVVNAGSNDLSVFAVAGAELRLVERVSTRGVMPISVTEREGIVYVLNAGEAGGIQGFWLSRRGALLAIPGSSQKLSGDAVMPAQISLLPGARAAVVSEKATQNIDVFTLGLAGRALPAQSATRQALRLSDSISRTMVSSSSPKQARVVCRPTMSTVAVCLR